MNDQAFTDRASVAVLAHNESLIGQCLRSLPEWLLCKADQWAQLKAAHQAKKATPYPTDYLPMADPWQFLLDVPAIAPETKRVFRAAQSWLFGARKLFRLGTGFATGNTDWYQEVAEAKAKGDKRREDRAQLHIAKKFVLSPLIQQDVAAQNNPALSKEVQGLLKERQAQINHREDWQRGQAFNPILRMIEIRRLFPLEFFLVQHWLCFPESPWPGLMFWSNNAITKFWLKRRGIDPARRGNLGRDSIQKTRQRLGLVPVSQKHPNISDIRMNALGNGAFMVIFLARNGATISEHEMRPAT